MFRKLVKRLFLLGLGLFGLGLVVVLVSAYLVHQEPSFYAELSGLTEVPETHEEDFKRRVVDFEKWATRSISMQRARQQGSTDPAVRDYNPSSDTYVWRLSETELNAELNSKAAGDVRDPRVRLLENRMQVGVEVSTGESGFVLSVELAPEVTADGMLHLEIQSGRLGKLPLPLGWMLGFVPKGKRLSSGEARLDLNGPKPVFIVDLFKGQPRSTKVKSINCASGELLVEFQAPQLYDKMGRVSRGDAVPTR